MRRKLGAFALVVSLSLWLVDRFSSRISDGLGALFCGADYLAPVDGTLGDASCGFNADLYLSGALLLLFFLGLFWLLSAKER